MGDFRRLCRAHTPLCWLVMPWLLFCWLEEKIENFRFSKLKILALALESICSKPCVSALVIPPPHVGGNLVSPFFFTPFSLPIIGGDG